MRLTAFPPQIVMGAEARARLAQSKVSFRASIFSRVALERA
jgi:hypothetical protein